MERLFTNEVQVYDTLSRFEGIYIPRCRGAYTLDHEDRELPEDRSVNVILFQLVKGTKLSDTWPQCYSTSQKSVICDQIKVIAQEMNDHGVVWPCVCADNFIVELGTRSIVAYDFSGTLLQDQSHSRYKMNVRSQNHLINEFLRRLGFRSELGDLEQIS